MSGGAALPIINDYEQHLGSVDAEFRRVYLKFASRMQCGKGCSMCCSQMFSISLIEAAYISRAVKAMPEPERDRLKEAARGYLVLARELTGSAASGGADDTLVPRPGVRLPCPALVDNACSIYNVRPIICRKWGIPIFNPAKPEELQACELNFAAGEEVDVEGLLEPQVELLEQWIGLKDRARTALEHPKMTVTIAEAIATDCDEILFGQHSRRQPSK